MNYIAYHREWDAFINSWLSGEISDSDFLDFFNLVTLFRESFRSFQTLTSDLKETMAEFLGII